MQALGNLFIVSAPSGAGKTSLVRSMIKELDNILPSVSHTTRERRAGEIDTIDYNFVSTEEFQHMVAKQVFLEHAEVFNHFYGTSKQWVIEQLASGMDVVLEIDWQGGQQIKKLFPECISVFILPPSIEALRDRLQFRKQDSHDIIKHRLSKAGQELVHLNKYDYVIVNEDFNKALQELISIVRVARLKMRRQTSLHSKLIDLLFRESI